MNIKKCICLLAAPVLSLSFFFGCSNSKGTVEEVVARYNEVMTSYTKNINVNYGELEGIKEVTYNNIFKFANVDKIDEAPESNDSSADLDATKKKKYLTNLLYPSFDFLNYGNKNLHSSSNFLVLEYELLEKIYDYDINGVSSENATFPITQLSTVYQTLNSLIFNYYSNWKEHFVNGVNIAKAAKKVNSKELVKLYEKVNALNKTLKRFEIHQKDLKEEVMLYNVDGKDFALVVAGFNKEYNKVMDASLSFVRYFEELHIKYCMKDYVNNSVLHMQREYDSALLHLAEAAYLESVKSFENLSTCELALLGADETKTYHKYLLPEIKSLVKYDDTSVIFERIVNDGQFESVNKGIVAKECENIGKFVPTDENAYMFNDAILKLRSYNKKFTKSIEIYRKVLAKVDVYRYATSKADDDKLNNFIEDNKKACATLRNFENNEFRFLLGLVKAL